VPIDRPRQKETNLDGDKVWSFNVKYSVPRKGAGRRSGSTGVQSADVATLQTTHDQLLAFMSTQFPLLATRVKARWTLLVMIRSDATQLVEDRTGEWKTSVYTTTDRGWCVVLKVRLGRELHMII
jgi:hypothetical protein